MTENGDEVMHIRTDSFQEFTAAVAEAQAGGAVVRIVEHSPGRYEAEARRA